MTKPPEHEDRKETAEEFLSRWSRRKREARAGSPAAAPARPPVAEVPPVLPPLETLGKDADFSAFLHPKVDERLRRAALKKLFSDPHFNVMDGLDVYIDDYSKDDPIPEAMLKELRHAQDILNSARERREEEARRRREAGRPPHDHAEPAAAAPGGQAPAPGEPAAAGTIAAPDAAAPAAASPEPSPQSLPVKRG
jgi:hypothetical protein